MITFKSKPVSVSDQNNCLTIVCDDGSIWRWHMALDTPCQVAEWKRPEKKEKAVAPVLGYTEAFEYMWKLWSDNIKNGSNKKSSFTAWLKLSPEESTALCYSIAPYSRTGEDVKYLKRCETYINQKHWEGLDGFEAVVPPMSDPAWKTQIRGPNGITEEARIHVESFGMDVNEAWRAINEDNT